MEYSKDNTMTRKEYLKSKKKQNFFLSKLKYVLLVVVVILLGIYVFKQLNIYNNVTKLANRVVEETKLAQTMTMYYVSEPYAKGGKSTVMLYKAYDESRTTISGSEDFSNIQINNNKLYGTSENLLYAIDLTTNTKEQITDKKIQDYVVTEDNIYLRISDGIYKYNIEAKKLDKIIKGKSNKLLVDENNIFVIAEGKTSQSIIRYNLNGEAKKQLSEKYIVTSMNLIGSNIYFINSKDSKMYVVSKNGGKINKVSDNKVLGNSNIICYKDNIFYINKGDGNTLYMLNAKTGNDERIIKKSIASIQIDNNVIYYNLSNSIGIYKYNLDTGKTAQVTSVRTNEYICKN